MAESTKQRRIRLKEGDVFAISLGRGEGFAYCRYLTALLTEFFDLSSEEMLPLEVVANSEILFTVWVSKEPFTSGRWLKMGQKQVTYRTSPVFYKQDPISKRLFLYQDGREKPATISECQGLENAAVWSANHIEDRLRDHFAGRPNKWVESLKPKVPLQ